MMRVTTVCIWVAISCLIGVCFAQLAARSVPLREKLGIWSGRGRLLALVHGRGIYQTDVDRAIAESRYLAGTEVGETTGSDRQSALSELIANYAARSRAARERIPWIKWKREGDLLRWQFRDDKTWWSTLRNNWLNFSSVLPILCGDLRARQWISMQISREVDVSEEECRRFYETHLEDFFINEHVRVSHLFLAAPPEAAPEIVETKRMAIEALSVRLVGGEDFDTLAAENSEDEATKLRGGDLGFVSADRMPPDFLAAALKLRPGEISRPVRTRLGFHILKLIDKQSAHRRTFEEARSDIALALANRKREIAVKKMIVDLGAQAEYLRRL